jgi:hypothetical protein
MCGLVIIGTLEFYKEDETCTIISVVEGLANYGIDIVIEADADPEDLDFLWGSCFCSFDPKPSLEAAGYSWLEEPIFGDIYAVKSQENESINNEEIIEEECDYLL